MQVNQPFYVEFDPMWFGSKPMSIQFNKAAEPHKEGDVWIVPPEACVKVIRMIGFEHNVDEVEPISVV